MEAIEALAERNFLHGLMRILSQAFQRLFPISDLTLYGAHEES
jgi:hypothetical protein